MKRLLLCACLLIAAQGAAWSMDAGVNFDPEIFYDVYIIGGGQGSFVMRHVKIVDKNLNSPDPYLVIKSDKMVKSANDQGYIFIKGIISIVPSNFFILEPNAAARV